MGDSNLQKSLCSQIGALLEYPVVDFRQLIQMPDNQIAAISEPVLNYLKEFFCRMEKMKSCKPQEYYVQTFDLTPHCPMYLSVHLFGEESFRRSELMVGLKNAYERHGVFELTELPDHLAVILKLNHFLNAEEWSELVLMGILPMLPKMIAKLEKWDNPYALVLKAVQALLMEMEGVHV